MEQNSNPIRAGSLSQGGGGGVANDALWRREGQANRFNLKRLPCLPGS